MNNSLDFFLTRLQNNGTFIGAGKSPHKENYSDGRPKVDEGRTRDISMDSAESAFSRGGTGQLFLKQQRQDSTKRNKRDEDTNRKKPRFLSF